MEQRVQLLLENWKKIHLFFGTDAKRSGGRMAAKLAIKGMSFSVKDYEEIVNMMKRNTKWHQKIRRSKQLQLLYYAQFAGQPEKVKQALAYRKHIGLGGEETYRAAMYIKEEAQISKMKDVYKALKKKPGMRWFPIFPTLLAVLAGRPETPEEIAAAYEQYYNRLTELNWSGGKQGKLAVLLLVVGTGLFDLSVWERVGLLSKAMEEDGLDIYVYNAISLLALAHIEPEALPDLYALFDFIDEETDDLPGGDDLFLLATQLYTSSAVLNEMSDLDTTAIDFLDLVSSVIDGAFDVAEGSGDGGSDGGGDGGGGGGD